MLVLQGEPHFFNTVLLSANLALGSQLHDSSLFLLKELLALSTALSASLTAQIDFDSRQMKHCSTYNLAEGVDKDDAKARGIYQMASEEYELAVTVKKPNRDLKSFFGSS